MAYSEKVVDHYENPRNVGSFEKGDETVGTGMVGAPACGDVMKLQIRGELLAARELLKAKDEHIQTLQRENLLLTVITQKATHQQQPPDNRGWFRKLFS